MKLLFPPRSNKNIAIPERIKIYIYISIHHRFQFSTISAKTISFEYFCQIELQSLIKECFNFFETYWQTMILEHANREKVERSIYVPFVCISNYFRGVDESRNFIKEEASSSSRWDVG